jgi:hypothetical protein
MPCLCFFTHGTTVHFDDAVVVFAEHSDELETQFRLRCAKLGYKNPVLKSYLPRCGNPNW